ncbi:MAG TPA: hypothetical protein VKS21_13060, partial [Spirochaetota bacterium]|nr:hypothetical protein [Spirochaetota bacterium]
MRKFLLIFIMLFLQSLWSYHVMIVTNTWSGPYLSDLTTLMQGAGHTVSTMPDSGMPSGYATPDVYYFGHEITSLGYTVDFQQTGKGLIIASSNLFEAFFMVEYGNCASLNVMSVGLENTSHPVMNGLNVTDAETELNSTQVQVAKPTNDALTLVYVNSDPANAAAAFIYEAGSVLADGTHALGRRAGFYYSGGTMGIFTETLLNNM